MELGRLLLNVAAVVPGGIVAFFPSYSYLSHVIDSWQSSILPALVARKGAVFVEPALSADVESVLADYRRCCLPSEHNGQQQQQPEQQRPPLPAAAGRCRGAVLLSVVNGKLSEGINFADDMGRCVVLVGQPFPNSQDPELRERLGFHDRMHMRAHTDIAAPGAAGGSSRGRAEGAAVWPIRQGSGACEANAADKLLSHSMGPAARDHYTNMCAMAINQSVGELRSITEREWDGYELH